MEKLKLFVQGRNLNLITYAAAVRTHANGGVIQDGVLIKPNYKMELLTVEI